ncbi:phospholipase D/nuclease [Ceratobasidium sp. AG-I]|nr:phospholipase D/nuclease [Ceratobasidium sp. AG-I]
MSNFDDELALAISLSLQDLQPPRATTSRDEPIVISDSSDEEDVVVAGTAKTAASRASGSRPPPKPSVTTKKPTAPPPRKPAASDDTIDLDTTLNLEDEDTATESESDDGFAGLSIGRETKGKGKEEPLLVPSKVTTSKSTHTRAEPPPPPANSTARLSPMSAFRAERARMEQERIARLKRRRLDTTGHDNAGNDEDEDDEDNELDKRPSKRPSPTLTSSSHSSSKNKSTSASYAGSFNTPDRAGMFWHGALRQTANKHTTKSQDTKPVFRLTSDILPPVNAPTASSSLENTLSFAIVSSYSLDLPWLYSLFPPNVPVILIAQPGQDGRADLHHTLPGWVRTSPALPGGRGCMHVKLMLLFFKSGRLRVVIPTANFVPYDWRDIENSVWLQDIPLQTDPPPPPPPQPEDSTAITEGFGERLERVLKALNVAPAIEAHLIDQRASGEVRLPLRSLDELHARWDWSRVTAKLIPSIAGKHTGWPAVLPVGHVALMKAVMDMKAADEGVEIECQGSSIGAYSTSWTNEFMSSARGVSPETWLDIPKTRRTKAHPSGLKIVFPSLSTVDTSVLGRPGGGTIFCQRRQWDVSTFPKGLFVDSNSKRGKVLMHSKMILGILNDETWTAGKPKAWLYVGSHNFTPSAWGNLSGSGYSPIMNITNYELGVVMPLESVAQGDALACWKRPARAYVKGRDVPWMQTEYR